LKKLLVAHLVKKNLKVFKTKNLVLTRSNNDPNHKPVESSPDSRIPFILSSVLAWHLWFSLLSGQTMWSSGDLTPYILVGYYRGFRRMYRLRAQDKVSLFRSETSVFSYQITQCHGGREKKQDSTFNIIPLFRQRSVVLYARSWVVWKKEMSGACST